MAQAAVRPVLSLFLLVPALVAVVLLAREAGTPARRELAEVPVWSLHRPADSPTFRDEQGEGVSAPRPGVDMCNAISFEILPRSSGGLQMQRSTRPF